MPTPDRRPTRKAPGDYTGVQDGKLKAENAQRVLDAAETMSMAQKLQAVNDSAPVDYRDASRPKGEPLPVVEAEPAEPKEYRVRVVADIDQMTYGKEIIYPGDFSDPNAPKMPLLGGLKTYSFKEGRQYIVDENLYIHLRDLGYLYE